MLNILNMFYKVTRRLRMVLVLALVTIGLFTSLLGLSPSVGAQALPPLVRTNDDTLLLLRVRVQPADVSRVLAIGVDVLEARGPDYLLVLGDNTVLNRLRSQGFQVEVAQRNTQPSNAPFTYFGGYRTMTEHEQHLADVAAAYPALVKVIPYGVSWRRQQGLPNGHDLQAICITKLRDGDCALAPETDKARFFLMAAIHARELSTSEMAWRWIDNLVQGYGVDAEITALLDHSEMWVVPVANPDGRTRVEEGGNTPYLQRKNLHTANLDPIPSACAQPPNSSLLFNQDGVDLNRNADFKWGNAGTDVCEPTYQGAAAGSEPEEQAIEQLMRKLFHDQRDDIDSASAPITTTGAMLTLHSYSDLVLLPWGWTECSGSACNSANQAPNNAGLRAFAFRLSHFNGYQTGQPSELLYAASGTTDDWAYGRLGIAAATFEIGPSSDFDECGARFSFTAFTPPYSCQDERFWPLNGPAFLVAAKLARQPYALSLGPLIITTHVSVMTEITPTEAQTFTIQAQARDNALGLNGVNRPASQPISAAEVYVGLPPWVAGSPITLSASDGAFDTVSETVQTTLVFSATQHISAKQLIYIRAQDANGDWGPVSAAWLDPAPPAPPTPTPVPTPSPPERLLYLPLIHR